MIGDWLKQEPGIEVVGQCKDGEEAVEQAIALKPDVITLDVEMPRKDGITALQEIMEKAPTAVLMVSSVTTEGAKLTLKALELGAVDFVTKPQGGSSLKFVMAQDELIGKIRAAKSAKLSILKPRVTQSAPAVNKTDLVVAMASSTGGPKSLAELWKSLPKRFSAPILMVQHMPEGFTASLAQRLDHIGTVPCKEAHDGDSIAPGLAIIAPGGRHMTVTSKGIIKLDDRPTIHGVRPAADYLFQTAAELYGRRLVGVVLTGMGRDGADGAVAIRKAGGFVLGESEETAVIYGMPKAAKEAGGVDAEFPLHEMGHALCGVLSRRSKSVA